MSQVLTAGGRWSGGIYLACRLILAAVFIFAAVGKIADPSEFADIVAGFRVLPISSVNVFAVILPWMELFSGLALLSGVLVKSGAVVLAGLNAVFIAAAASAMARGLSIECGCFTLSRAKDMVGWQLIGRDVILLALCVVVIVWGGGRSEAAASNQQRVTSHDGP